MLDFQGKNLQNDLFLQPVRWFWLKIIEIRHSLASPRADAIPVDSAVAETSAAPGRRVYYRDAATDQI